MNMEFVTFEIAKKLKEKGYPQVKKDSLAMYNQDGDWFSLASNLDTFEYSFEDFDDNDCVCPTISQVLKWLREKKGLYVDISLYKKGYCTLIYETNFPYDKDYANSWRVNNTYNTYEEASIAGIEYVIDNLI